MGKKILTNIFSRIYYETNENKYYITKRSIEKEAGI